MELTYKKLYLQHINHFSQSIMKHALTIIFAAFILCACTNESKENDKIIGKWEPTSSFYGLYINDQVYEEVETSDGDFGFEFFRDGKGTIEYFGWGEEIIDNITWYISNGQLFITHNYDITVFDIIYIEDESMSIMTKDEEIEAGYHIKEIETYNFAKVK